MAEEGGRKARSDKGKRRATRRLPDGRTVEYDQDDLAAGAAAQGGGEVAAVLGQVMVELRGLHRRMEAMEAMEAMERGGDGRLGMEPVWGRYGERYRGPGVGWAKAARAAEWEGDREGPLLRRYVAPRGPRMPELPEAEIGDNLGLPDEFWSQFAAMFLKTCNVLCPASEAPTRGASEFVRWTGRVKQYARQRISGYRPTDLKKGG